MKEAYYFSHDSNARHDPKVLSMRSVYGMEGYGWYWVIIEMLREQTEYRLEITKYVWNALAMQMQCNADAAHNFVEDCINEFKLFETDGIYFWSSSLRKRMEMKDEKSEKAKKAAEARWKKRSNDAGSMQSQSKRNADAMQTQCDSNAIKESKVKESKVKESSNTTDDDFKKIEKAYCEIHRVFNMGPKDWPEVEKLLEKGISADLIIEVMKEKHAKKIKEGGSVKSFSFYIDAINERYNQIEQEETRLGFIDDL